MPASAQRIAFLRGHQDAVVCLVVTPDSQLLASGAEDGSLCIHHLPSSELVCSLQCSTEGAEDDTAVGAVAWHPKELAADMLAHLFSSSSSNGTAGDGDSSSSRGCRLLFAGVGSELLVLLLSPAVAPDSAATANGSHQGPAAAAAANVAPMQLQVLVRETVSQDDISSLSVNAAGTYLAVADDTGDVMLFDLQKLQQQLQELHSLPQQQQRQQKQQQQQQQPPLLQSKQQLLQPCRTIAGAHDPMATAVGFRGPHKPWQVLSGGVDNRVGLWDFSRPKKCCSSWNMQHMNGVNPSLGDVASSADSSSSSSSRDAAAVGREAGSQEQQGQLWNPPMVHSLAMPWALPAAPAAAAAAAGGGGLSGSTGASNTANGVSPSPASAAAAAAAKIPSIPAAVAKRLVAVARGDGVVAVFDADPDAKPLSKPEKQQNSSTSSSEAGGVQPAPQQRSGSRGRGKGGKAATKSQQQQQQQQAAGSGPQDSGQQQQQQPDVVSLQQQQQQQQWQQLSEVSSGFHVCLGPSLGGHTLPAAAVAFLPWDGGWRYLVSGGQDGRLLLWDWPAAFAAAATKAVNGDAAMPAATAAAANQGVSAESRCLLLEKEHKRKVNALCCCLATPAAAAAAISQPAVLLLVADTAPRISVYRVKL